LRWDPERPITLKITGKNRFSLDLETHPDPHRVGRRLFSLDRNISARAGNRITIRAILPDGKLRPLPDTPLLIAPRPPLPLRRRAAPSTTAAPALPRRVDILIPVYSGVDETVTCIRSVVATAGKDANIIVIDDASPDPGMAPALDGLAADGAITLMRNRRNLGFPRTANLGMKLHADNDVVILNADTEVFGDWLERLRAAAYRDDLTGTVTPLTNSGTIASYPASEEPELDSAGAADRDRLTAATNTGAMIEIPTGVGFCMYIKRDCLDTVGYFDAATFVSGYGEENDLCLRARKAGWRNVLAPDVYVRHSGNRSFGTRRAALAERNLRLLNLRYPGYDAEIQHFIEKDPAHHARRNLDEARLLETTGRRYVLFVSLALAGGVKRAVMDRMALARREGFSPILLKPDGERSDRCSLTVDEGGFTDLTYDFSGDELDALFRLLHTLELASIELHHFLDYPPAVIERLYRLGRPVDFRIHDYGLYCPRLTLLDGSGGYCGEPDAAACQTCIDKDGHRLNEEITVEALRMRSGDWLSQARRLIVPTESVAERLVTQFPDFSFEVEPHEAFIGATPIAPSVRKGIKVAVIGSIGGHKGYDLLLAMAKNVADRDLPIEFVVIGHTQDDRALLDTGTAFVTGEYDESEIDALIAREKPDLALFLSQFPETWCYALTHALRAQIPVASLDFGATSDRIRAAAADPLLYPLKIRAHELCDRLLSAFRVLPQRERDTAPVPMRQDAKWLPARPTLVFNDPAPLNTAKILRIDMAQQSTAFSAAVEALPLSKGLYVFSVRSAYAQSIIQKGLKLPALQIGIAPGASPNQVELMPGPQTASTWLCEPADQIIVKIKDTAATILLTSVVIPGMRPLEIDIRRLDIAEAPRPTPPIAKPAQLAQAQPARPAPPLPARQKSVSLKITAHIQNRGDVNFSEAQWAGLVGQRLWIESMTILPLDGISPEMIEYKAITATGVETPWVGGGASCGTRGIGVPLVGFALRGNRQAGGAQLSCEYGGILLSGNLIGPSRNGAPCRSPDVSDPIEAIWVTINAGADTGKPKPVDDTVPAAPTDEEKPAVEKAAKGKPAKKAKVDVEDLVPAGGDEPVSKERKGPIGPRFSKFRDPEQETEE
jgi:GT2 family glycosyltransferase